MSLGLCDAVGEKEAKDNYRRKELRADPTEVPLCLCRCGDNLTWVGGSSSAVEGQLPKLDVTGSIPVSRSRFSSLISSNYGAGGVIRRTGTGEEPVTGLELTALPAPLLHPATFKTVTFTSPYSSTPLMKTWRNPTIVTWLVPIPLIALATES